MVNKSLIRSRSADNRIRASPEYFDDKRANGVSQVPELIALVLQSVGKTQEQIDTKKKQIESL